MILTTFVPVPGYPFLIERSYVRVFCIEWWNTCVVTWGQACQVREVVGFGGYSVYFKFKDAFWEWNSSSWDPNDVFDDFYAIPPGPFPPVTCPDVAIRTQWGAQFNAWIMVMTVTGNDGTINGGPLLPAPPTYWKRFPALQHNYNWQLKNAVPSNVYPAPHC